MTCVIIDAATIADHIAISLLNITLSNILIRFLLRCCIVNLNG
jgi:hypothetical protein